MKVESSYDSLLRGVSQQVPQERAIGQHTEQVNMLSDPVEGLTRRHGSVMQAERTYVELKAEQWAAYQRDSANWRTFEYSSGGNDYVVLYRSKARPAGANPLPLLAVYNKTTKQFADLSYNVADSWIAGLDAGGISAITNVGKYVYMASNTQATLGTQVPLWNNATNLNQAVVWVRSGAYNRKISAELTRSDNTIVSYTVTTDPATYGGTLTTADIPASAPDYTKQVNDRVNAYNDAVTAHIRAVALSTTPAGMATIAATQLNALGVAAYAMGSHIILPGIKSVSVNDGGDGTLLRGVGDEVESVDKLTPIHFANHVVKVRTRNSGEAFYMKAVPKRLGTTGPTEVTWVECAGDEFQILQGFAMMTVVGNTAHYASTPAILQGLTGTPHPDFARSTAGDGVSNPVPYVTNRRIDYLGTFQDRLVIGSGGVLLCSKTGDYLNFFRSSMLTVPDDDAFELRAVGPEDDVIRHSVLHDQSMVLFGDRRQYRIDGRSVLTPTNANMSVMSNYAGTTDAPAHTAGGLIFYARKGEKFASVHQVQPGQGLQNSPESFPASSQVATYISGTVIDMTSSSNPSMLFVRTTGRRSSVFTFTYVDTVQGRQLDSWSRWDFDPALGVVVGMSPGYDGLKVFFLRLSGTKVYIVCDLCSMNTGMSPRPYLDSMRPVSSVTAGTGSVTPTSTGGWYAAFDNSTDKKLVGSLLRDAGALVVSYPTSVNLWVGAKQVAYFEPTNPYMRDNKGKVISSGRLTITAKRLRLSKSSGFKAEVFDTDGNLVDEVSFNGRTMGEAGNLIGIEHVSTQDYTVPIGRETRDYAIRLSARSWLPFTVTSMEWRGQFFNRTQRF